jgi:hypothetical protein
VVFPFPVAFPQLCVFGNVWRTSKPPKPGGLGGDDSNNIVIPYDDYATHAAVRLGIPSRPRRLCRHALISIRKIFNWAPVIGEDTVSDSTGV